MQRARSSLTPTVLYDDPDEGIRWLEDVLGFRTCRVFRDGSGAIAFALLAWGDNALFVSGRPPDDNPWGVVGPASIALGAADAAEVDRTHARALAHGAAIVREPHLSRTPLFPEGSHQFDVRDPEGNLWTVGTYRPEACPPRENPQATGATSP